MRNRFFVLLLLLVLAVLAAGEVILPRLASQAVADGMRELTGTTQVRASVQKTPAFAMLGGSFDRVNVEAENVTIDKITFAGLHAVLTQVQLDRERLFFRRSIGIERVQDVDLTITLTQEEVARYINHNVKGVKNAAVVIANGRVEASSSLSFGGLATVAVTLEGTIVSDGQKLKFVTNRFMINSTPVGNLGGAMLAEIPLLELKKLPFGVTVRDIAMQDGKVVIRARNPS